MGNQIQTSSTSLGFLSSLSEPLAINHHGKRLEVYRNLDVPTQYFVRLTSAYGEQYHSAEHLHLLQRLRQSNHPNIATLVYFHLAEAQLVCNRQLQLHSYYAFYNFRLGDVVERKYVSNRSVRFRPEQLWYIAYSILEVLRELQKEDLPIGGFTSRDFYLTPEGELKYVPHELRKGTTEVNTDYSHVGLLKVIKDPFNLRDHYLAPEQLRTIRTASYHQQDNYRALSSGDVYSLGMVILECLNLESSVRYYSLRALEVKQEKLNIKLSLKHQPSEFIRFISRCLEPDPINRLTVQQAMQMVSTSSRSECISFLEENDSGQPPQYQPKTSRLTVRQSKLTSTTTTSRLKLRSR